MFFVLLIKKSIESTFSISTQNFFFILTYNINFLFYGKNLSYFILYKMSCQLGSICFYLPSLLFVSDVHVPYLIRLPTVWSRDGGPEIPRPEGLNRLSIYIKNHWSRLKEIRRDGAL